MRNQEKNISVRPSKLHRMSIRNFSSCDTKNEKNLKRIEIIEFTKSGFGQENGLESTSHEKTTLVLS